ncbi:MAG: hypothetical protein ACK587_02960 [Cyanobacteriota bacterium]
MPASSSSAFNETSRAPGPRILRSVVVGSGLEASLRQPGSACERAAQRLAHALSLHHRRIGDPRDPQGQLRQLPTTGGGWLASLPLDPGHPLEQGGTWAEALGAWRQPTLLVIAYDQRPSGAAAASVALLRQWRVPLLGVVQWGGPWSPDQRRRDGLPWLGGLEDTGGLDPEESAFGVTDVLRRRWSLLDSGGLPTDGAEGI